MQNITKEDLNKWLDKIGKRIFKIKFCIDYNKYFIENYKKGAFTSLYQEFILWIKFNYKSNIIMLLTGLLEKSDRKDDLNFQKFLNCVEKYGIEYLKKELFSKKPKYFSDFNNIKLEMPDDNDFIEKQRCEYIENTYFKSLNIQEDINNINKMFKKLQNIRNKHIAHFTDSSKTSNITYDDLEDIAISMINIFDKYAHIIMNTTYIFD